MDGAVCAARSVDAFSDAPVTACGPMWITGPPEAPAREPAPPCRRVREGPAEPTGVRGRGVFFTAGGRARIAGGRAGARTVPASCTAGATRRSLSTSAAIAVTCSVCAATLGRRTPGTVSAYAWSACAWPATPSSQPAIATPAINSRRLITGRATDRITGSARMPGQRAAAEASLRTRDRPETTRPPWR
jgi:hypothetical protein